MVSIEQVINSQGDIVYPSTCDVAEQVIGREGDDPQRLEFTAFVAQHVHAGRCCELCRRMGLKALAVEGINLPRDYDPQSGQDFTRSPDVWQVYDLAILIGEERRRRICG